MNTLRTTTIALAMAASATVAHGAVASWNYDGTDALQNSWGNAGSWTEAPAWDGNDVLTLDASVISANRTLTLDGDRAVDTLSVYTTATSAGTNRTYSIAPGTGGTLQVKNLIVDRDAPSGSANGYNAFILDLKSVVTRIDNGSDIEPDAVWQIFPSSDKSTYTSVRLEVGEVRSIAGSHLRIDSISRGGASSKSYNQVVAFTTASPNFLGDITVNHPSANTRRMIVEVGASDALGVGNVAFTRQVAGTTETGLGFTATTNSSHSNNISVADQTLWIGAATGTTATLNGNFTGNGHVSFSSDLIGNSRHTIGTGFVRLAGTNNTLSGNISVGDLQSTVSNMRPGYLQFDGVWVGAGNVTLSYGVLSGSGTLGMASGSAFATTVGTTGSTRHAAIAPGTDGTIGMLTLGTPGNENTFTIDGGSTTGSNEVHLLIDLGGEDSDRLILNGDLTIGDFTKLVLNEVASLTASSYTLMTYGTRTGTFSGVYWGDTLIDDPTLPGSIAGQYHLVYGDNAITLVPEPAALSLLALGAIPMMRRRR